MTGELEGVRNQSICEICQSLLRSRRIQEKSVIKRREIQLILFFFGSGGIRSRVVKIDKYLGCADDRLRKVGGEQKGRNFAALSEDLIWVAE